MRIVLLLGAVVLGLGSLSGCSDKPTTGAATGAGPAGTGAPASPQGKPGGGRIPKGPPM